MSNAPRTLKFAVALAVALPLLSACQSGGAGPVQSGATASSEPTGFPSLPVPSWVKVVPPAAGVPAEYAAFSGTWGGYWDGIMPSLLIVEHVDAGGNAEGTYIWGAVPQWNAPAGHTRFHTKIVNKTLSWGGDHKLQFTYSDGKLHGERYVNGGQEGDVMMAKAQ